MIVEQLLVRGPGRAPTPPPDGPPGGPESARPEDSFLSLWSRGAALLAALVTSFTSCFGAKNALYAGTTMLFGRGRAPTLLPRPGRKELAKMGGKLKFCHLSSRKGTIYVPGTLLAPPEGDLGLKSYVIAPPGSRAVANRRCDSVPIPRASGLDGGMKSSKIGGLLILKSHVHLRPWTRFHHAT